MRILRYTVILLMVLFGTAQGIQSQSEYAAASIERESTHAFSLLETRYLASTALDFSFYQDPDEVASKKKWYKTDTGTSLIVSAGLIGLGLYTYKDNGFLNRKDVKDVINRYLPDFHDPIDDYIQYIPYVAVFALDAFGIKSKHTAKRKFTTMATAIGLNLIVVQGLKYTVKEPRPDGSGDNSFPSGHTTTAFTGAHIFHKEYAHLSPWYSIGGYFLAAVTGVFRQLNNKHWISDVLVGAGLGISLTELAYFMNDKWWGTNEVNTVEKKVRHVNLLKPSFIGFKAGFASLTELRSDDLPGISSKTGFKLSVEGAYFFNTHWGVGGEVGFQSFPNEIDADVQKEFTDLGYDIIPQASGNKLYYASGYYQIPFQKNAVGAKLSIGAISGPNTRLYLRELEPPAGSEDVQDILYAEYTPYTDFSWGTGVYYKRVIGDNLSLSLYADYIIADSRYDYYYLEGFSNGEPVYSSVVSGVSNWDSWSVGASLNIMLW